MSLRRLLVLSGLAVAGLVLAGLGCAAVPSAAPQVAGAEEAIREAMEIGVSEDMGVALYLAMARQELTGARRALAIGDDETARSFAERSRADAELAGMLAHEIGTRGAAVRAMDQASRFADLLGPPHLPRAHLAATRSGEPGEKKR